MYTNRILAISTLQNIIDNKVFFIKTEDAFTNMLVLTSLRHLVYINQIIAKYSKKMSPAHNLLVCAIVEILYLDTPDYAVLKSYVDIAKDGHDKYVANFVNAILRKVCLNKDVLIKNDNGKFFPSSFLQILRQDYDAKTIAKIEADCLVEPMLNLVYKDGSQELLENTGKIEKIAGYEEGLWWVQDKASSMAVEVLGDIRDTKVLDLCSAPGGKTAQLLSKGAKVVALDISESRLEILKENMTRLKLKPENIIVADAVDYLQNYKAEKFDIILLDAPCSATGTIRRHPEIVHLKTLTDVRKQAQIQQKLLILAGNALKKDGVLLYVVCSISKFEGERQIKEFLQNDEYVEIERIRTMPTTEMDAFFICKLKKVK